MIARRTLLVLINNAVGAILGFVLLNYLSAYVGADAWGWWLYATSIVAIPFFVTGLGFTTAHVRRLSEGHDEGHANGTFLAIKLALLVAFVAVTLVGVTVYKTFNPHGIVNLTERLLWLALAFAALSALRQFFDFTFQGHRLVATAELVLTVETLAAFVCVGSVALAIGLLAGYDVPLAFVAQATVDLLGLRGPLNLHLAAGASPADLEYAAFWVGLGYIVARATSVLVAAVAFALQGHPVGRPRREDFRFYVRFAVPFALLAAFAPFVSQFDRVLLGYFGDESWVSLFNLPFVLLGLMLVISTTVGNVLFPTLSAIPKEDRPAAEATIQRTQRYLGMTLVPQVMLAVVFARDAIHVTTSTNPEFEPAVVPLQVLALSFFFNAYSTPARSVILAYGRPAALVRIQALHVVVLTLLNLVFIPSSLLGIPLLGMGVLGAAIATAITSAFSFAILQKYSRGWYHASYLPRSLLRPLLAGLVAGAILWVARSRFEDERFDRLLELLPVAAVGLTLFALVLFAIGGIRREDVSLVRDLMHPGRMARYVGRDMKGRRGSSKAKPRRPRPPKEGHSP